MPSDKRWRFFLVLLACAAAFIWRSGTAMPALVASHFDALGIPNGRMPRDFYIGIMLAAGVGLPGIVAAIAWFAMGRPNARINLPNGAYWLAPERRDETVAWLRSGVMGFSALLVVFLCYSHWLVVRANLSRPVLLSGPWFTGGMVVFLLAVLAWTIRLVARFRRAA